MALTATATKGFEELRRFLAEQVILVPGDPGVTYEQGDLVTLTNGVLAKISASAKALARVARKTVCPAATTAMPLPQEFNYLNIDADSKYSALVPIRPLVADGVRVFKATFASHQDDTVVSYSSASRYIEATTGFGADDRPNGALVYVYEGTGAGQVNIVEDYDHTGGTVEKMLVLHRPFATDLDSTSKIIVVSGEAAASKGVSFLGRIDAADENNLTAADGADDGDFAVLMDFREAADFLKNLTLPVIDAAALYG